MDTREGKDFNLPLITAVSLTRGHNGGRLTWHSHEGFELLFLLDGATAYEFSDEKILEVPGGHFLVIPPNTPHRGMQDIRMPATICGLELSPQPGRTLQNTPFLPSDLRWLVTRLHKSNLTVCPFSPDLKQAVIRLIKATSTYPAEGLDVPQRVFLRSLACSVIFEAGHQLISRRESPPMETVNAAASYLRKHFRESVSMFDLTRHMGYSRARTFQFFKSGTGMTPNDYLQRIRIEKAQELLHKTNQSITDIALGTGFNSGQYFSTVFRRYTGVTPSEFRGK